MVPYYQYLAFLFMNGENGVNKYLIIPLSEHLFYHRCQGKMTTKTLMCKLTFIAGRWTTADIHTDRQAKLAVVVARHLKMQQFSQLKGCSRDVGDEKLHPLQPATPGSHNHDPMRWPTG